MNKYIVFLSIILMIGYSCSNSSDEDVVPVGTNSIYATFEDGSGFFNPEVASPYGDTVKFIFTTHFPEESNNPIDITQMRVKAYSPVSIVFPSGNNLVDLTKETKVKIVQLDGKEKSCILKGVIRKSSAAQIKSFELPVSNLPAFISEENKVVGLVPGGMSLASQKPKLVLSSHATVSPDTSIVQDFSKSVTYTVTAENGTKVNYTVKAITPQKLTSGLRSGSGRLLWSKTLAEMGIDNTNHMSTSIAVAGDYLVVNTRNIANRYFNRFSGNYEGDMTMGGIQSVNFMNFYSTNDNAGNVLISNLVTAAGQTLYIYKWNGVKDNAPVEFIRWTNDITGSQAGRKISVKGDLNGDALIFIGASNSNNTILRWQVTGGVLKSQTPDKLVYPGTKKWALYADIISAGTSLSDNLFLSAYPSDLVCTNISTSAILGQVDLTASGYGYNHSIDLSQFNNSNYLAAISISSMSGFSYLYDVTDPANLSVSPTSSNYGTACVYKTATIASAVANGNSTGDVILKVSDDGYKMILYTLVTNGSVVAYEFDCVDTDKI